MEGVGLELEINCSGPTNCREIMKARTSRIFAIRKAIPLILASICVSAIGCRDSAIIRSAESRSPDGRWVASASTEQFGGPGTAYVGTQVSLKAVNGSQPAVEVLGLSNDSAYPSGITNVGMNWISASHLELTYKGHASVDFQVVRCAGIDISLRDLSGGTVKSSQ
jgi:hypothetical protein